MALLAVGSSLYYNSTVSRQFQSTLTLLDYNYYDVNISRMTTQLYSRQESTTALSTESESDSFVVSIPFHAEAKQLAIHTDKGTTHNWTTQERQLMRKYFQAHSRHSLQKKVPTPHSALFWNEDFRNVINFYHQRHVAGVYDFSDLFPDQKKVMYDPRQLARAWGQRQQ